MVHAETASLPAMRSGRCKQCNQRLVEIDNYGERLIGCIECNRWTWRGSKRAIELPEGDVEALRAGCHSIAPASSQVSLRPGEHKNRQG
jgi:hypothetical protein